MSPVAESSSQRMARVQAPIIPVIAELTRQHPGTISLGQGVVFYGPPRSALAAARRFGDTPEAHRYGPVRGQPALLEAIYRKLAEENRVPVGPGRRVMVTAGANMAFLNAIQAIADIGDEIILPLPYYFNQEMAIRMIGCQPVFVATDEAYRPRLEALRDAVTSRTRAIVTISPNNPSGAVYSEAELRVVNALCHGRGLYHISDEAYEYFTWGAARHFSPASIQGGEAHTIALYSLSKAYGFAGLRIGYLVYPEHLDTALFKVQDTNLICAPLISQVAAAAAMAAGRSYSDGYRGTLARVREGVLLELEAVRDFCQIADPQGAFYLLIKVDTRLDSLTLAERLVREHGVAVIPGIAFGMRDGCHLRIAYGALEPETAQAGIRRLTKGLKSLVSRN